MLRNKLIVIIGSVVLILYTTYVALDTFVIPTEYSSGSSEMSASSNSSQTTSSASSSSTSANAASSIASTDSTYSDDNISITISTYRENDTNIYVADVTVSDPSYLKTALANNTYGRNIKATTSDIADSVNAILAINGDFYGARQEGYVIRDGILYRDTAKTGQEDLVVMDDGTFTIINEDDISAQELINQGAVQVLSFGPALIEDGNICVTSSDEVGKAMANNPRTAIGQISDNHYVLVVSDGRTDESEGLSLLELANFMNSLGVQTAYNLDGGGSSTMVFQGKVINNPTTNGNKISERSVSDIVYISK